MASEAGPIGGGARTSWTHAAASEAGPIGGDDRTHAAASGAGPIGGSGSELSATSRTLAQSQVQGGGNNDELQ